MRSFGFLKFVAAKISFYFKHLYFLVLNVKGQPQNGNTTLLNKFQNGSYFIFGP